MSRDKFKTPVTKELTAKQVKAWFAQHAVGMVVALEHGEYFGKQYWFSENENVFFSANGKERLTATVSYEEGCPTCGGAWIKSWTLTYEE